MVSGVYIWERAPFIRIFICIAVGILLEFHIKVSLQHLVACVAGLFLLIVFYSALYLNKLYRLRTGSGVLLHLLIITTGAILFNIKETSQSGPLSAEEENRPLFLATLEQPLTEKANSYKTTANLIAFYRDDSLIKLKNRIIIYFKKDSSIKKLSYGSRVIFKKYLQQVNGQANPGSFDYRQYCLFQGITHQVYLKQEEIRIINTREQRPMQDLIFSSREWVINKLRTYIKGKKEAGLAEALLIGYKEDLDKELITSYTNTGVIHVIAISGLHLGLIYGLLLLITRPLSGINRIKWARLAIILAGLWGFSFIAGAQPSVLRSALMFSFIATGEVINKKNSVFNSLALSAVLLLCYNPYWLWDAGFQLSYAAVLGIIIFFRPLYNWLPVSNILADMVWKLIAVTISAQLLTLPLCIYQFHQFPLLFLFTNIIAVPLSSIILIGEIVLCAFSGIPPFAWLAGEILFHLIRLMNSWIEYLERFPFSLWQGFSISVFQTFLLTIIIITACTWLMNRQRIVFWITLSSTLCFSCIRSVSFIGAESQKKLIIYNLPRKQALELVDGRNSCFIGDSVASEDPFLQKFHIEPFRTLHRIEKTRYLKRGSRNFIFGNRHILLVDSANAITTTTASKIDILIISKGPGIFIPHLLNSMNIRQVVTDGSCPAWKVRIWKKDCDSLNIPFHDVSEKGAFVMNL